MPLTAGDTAPGETPGHRTRLVVFVKRDCPTCETVRPSFDAIAAAGLPVHVVGQDPESETREFLADLDRVEVHTDADLALSDRYDVETVPSFYLVHDATIEDVAVGWDRKDMRSFLRERVTDIPSFADLPEHRPGCGARNQDPQVARHLRVRRERDRLRSRRLRIPPLDDVHERFFDLGLTDGLPIVPPSEARVLDMLDAVDLDPDGVVAKVPPSLAEVTVEKIAVNAVMAGCRPEYLPVVLAAVEAACTDRFNVHGVLCTTTSVGPIVIVNGPIRTRLGMNGRDNVLGQGNRANLTIGRALQLVVRNVGGGRPGEIDKAVFGHPGKVSFCFAEDEENSPWPPLHVRRGAAAGSSTVTLFAGEGPRLVLDQSSQTPESLAASLARQIQTISHHKLGYDVPLVSDQFQFLFDVVVVVSPPHRDVFDRAGWDARDIQQGIHQRLMVPVRDLLRDTGGCQEGVPRTLVDPEALDREVPKLASPESIVLVAAGGDSALMSAIIPGWQRGERGSDITTQEVAT